MKRSLFPFQKQKMETALKLLAENRYINQISLTKETLSPAFLFELQCFYEI